MEQSVQGNLRLPIPPIHQPDLVPPELGLILYIIQSFEQEGDPVHQPLPQHVGGWLFLPHLPSDQWAWNQERQWSVVIGSQRGQSQWVEHDLSPGIGHFIKPDIWQGRVQDSASIEQRQVDKGIEPQRQWRNKDRVQRGSVQQHEGQPHLDLVRPEGDNSHHSRGPASHPVLGQEESEELLQ